ncbi:hypothetical protein SAMN04487792_1498 [Lactobacillus bombicola]|jgi:hypothetical protein|uniref:Uncharacterized protein n=1 Tax=Lactobacillus bombicola TaxID=1505723 RepID=A0A1I1TLB8_9LACO|nr:MULTISPECIES: hypothetical protein [Lactobacillus]MCO6528358.1 hypothetical protein [Lactobacillus sp.]RHW49394.1 hypothetical protein DS834_07355 [Lactobacillus bombicola]RHW53232.1 hypothetical protein DS833_00245 [Lactobacillus bombicola]RHW55187.1 hypothetical protein DS835_01015 [Lactobacillus bombicola]RMC42736.1 hypothetical protein F5ESL0233_00655 [Lactobacillus sp. ESL0233]
MANGAQNSLRRVNPEQNLEYKRVSSFCILLVVTLVMTTVTFLNPFFMKGQLRTNNNEAVIVRHVNNHFNELAKVIGANKDVNSNLLTTKQTQPIADHIIDYAIGVPWFKFNNIKLAQQILHDIESNIDQEASSDAQLVQKRLKRQGKNAPYDVIDAFNLDLVTLGGNIAFVILVVNITLFIMIIISLRSLINDMLMVMNSKTLVHTITAAGMWAGFWLILISGILAMIPIIFNVDEIAVLGCILEIGSSIFLDYVIAGVVLYILSAIPWEISSPNN